MNTSVILRTKDGRVKNPHRDALLLVSENGLIRP